MPVNRKGKDRDIVAGAGGWGGGVCAVRKCRARAMERQRGPEV